MIITKSEFREMFGYNHASEVSRLLKNKIIVANEFGMIDLENKTNKKYKNSRKKEVKNKTKKNNSLQAEIKQIKNKSDSEIGLQVELLNQKLLQQKQQATLLDLKIAKEKREVIETEVLDKVLMTIFNHFFQNLAELPTIYIDDLVSIVLTEKNPKEQAVKFLTDKIVQQIQCSLDIAQNTANKNYSDV